MPISLVSNIASMIAGRRLEQTNRALEGSLERLSSGMRINRASDDAAGLAIADNLRASNRILTRGVRNINDGISALNIGQSALQTLSSVVIRQAELAEQAANGTYSLQQRKSLNSEADALSKEFNRIVQSTQFNGRQILDGSYTDLRIQAGFGTNESLLVGVGTEFSRTVGSGTFQAPVTLTAENTNVYDVTAADLNGDGNADLIETNNSAGYISVRFGNGDGNFQGRVSYYAGVALGTRDADLADVNGDGVKDLIVNFASSGANKFSVLLGSADGTFGAATTYTTVTGRGIAIEARDMNNDGVLDVVHAMDDGSIAVHIGNSNGTFGSAQSVTIPTTGTQALRGLAIADYNGDGRLDMATLDTSANQIVLFYGNGNGTFQPRVTIDYGAGMDTDELRAGDFNRDGVQDLVMVSGSGAGVLQYYQGSGNGSFQAAQSFTTGYAGGTLQIGDMNGDGYLDLVSANQTGNNITTILGNGDGTFRAGVSSAGGSAPRGIGLGDLNKDGVLDVVTGSWGVANTNILLANTTTTTSTQFLDLLSVQGGRDALTSTRAALNRISLELGKIGAYQSRLGTASGLLDVTTINQAAAESRIRDVDVSSEAGEMVRNQILRNITAAILSQANQAPRIALSLLQG